jgi:putative phosphoribosyl transferase
VRFANREDAGRRLAALLSAYRGRADVVVLGLPRGGVPVAAQVARALGAPLDVFLVRKLGVPGHEELAMGAIAEGGTEVLDHGLIDELGIQELQLAEARSRERDELHRRARLYRGNRSAPDLRGRTVIVVDDGLATGATMEAAVSALRQQAPSSIVVAVPVGAPSTCARLARLADAVFCAERPRHLEAVGL